MSDFIFARAFVSLSPYLYFAYSYGQFVLVCMQETGHGLKKSIRNRILPHKKHKIRTPVVGHSVQTFLSSDFLLFSWISIDVISAEEFFWSYLINIYITLKIKIIFPTSIYIQATQIVALCDLSSSEHHKTYLFLHTSVSINFSIRGAGLGGVALGTELGREEYSFHLSSPFKLILLNIYSPVSPKESRIFIVKKLVPLP